MVLIIIYLLGIVIFTTLKVKENKQDFLVFDNYKLQRFMRAIFVILIILAVVTPCSWLLGNAAYNAAYNAAPPIMKIFIYVGISFLYLIFGLLAGLITHIVMKVIKWIWK